MRTSALFGLKTPDFLKFMASPHGQRGWVIESVTQLPPILEYPLLFLAWLSANSQTNSFLDPIYLGLLKKAFRPNSFG